MQPVRTVGQRSSHPQQEATSLAVFVPVWLVITPCEGVQLWVCLICVIATCSMGLCKFGWVWLELSKNSLV